MKRPVLTTMIALGVIMLGLLIAGMLKSGETRIEKSVVLNGTPDRVWPFFADLRKWPEWYRAPDGTRMTYSALIVGTSSGIGAERHAEESFGTWWEEKVTAFEPEQRLELTGTKTPGRTGWRQDIVLAPEGADKTRVTWKLEYEVHGPIVKLLNGRQAEQFGRYMEGGLANIDPLIPTVEDWGPRQARKGVAGAEPNGLAAPVGEVAPAGAAPSAPVGETQAAPRSP